MFWNNEGKVVDCVGEFQSAVAALRGLLKRHLQKVARGRL